MKKIIKSVFLIILLTSSCKKDANNTITNTIIYGTIVDSVTGKPVEGVKILKIAYYLTGSNTSDTTLATTTDNEGKYSLNVSVATVDADRISFNALSDRYCFNRISYTSGTINECNIRLVKWGYLKFHCKNTSPYNSYDDLWIDILTANSFDGYYTNFLQPGNIAAPATEANIAKIKKEVIVKIIQTGTIVDRQKELAEKLRGKKIEIKARANEAGKLYAAVSEQEIKNELKRLGFNIGDAKISSQSHLKEAGD